MKTTLWLVASLALLSSCGTARCSASTCDGCCDANGECQPGSVPTACGQSGFTCQQCSIASACVNGMCSAFTGGGGSGTTGGGAGTTGGGVGTTGGGAGSTGGGSGTTGGGSGTTGGGTGSTGGGSGSTGGGVGASPLLRAFNLNIAGATLPASCWRGGVAPPNSTFPAQTVEVLVFGGDTSEQYVGLQYLSPLRLGDSPIIRPPPAVHGEDGVFAFLENRQTPMGTQYTEARQTQLRFSFDDVNAASTTGTLDLNAQYACIMGSGACPSGASRPVDAESCNVTLNFTAQSVPVTPAWTTPASALNGATRYLVTFDETPARAISTPSCFRNNNVPAGAEAIQTQNARRLEVWQATSTHLRVPLQVWRLGDAPEIRINGDLPLATNVYTHQQQLTVNGADFSEVRQSTASIDRLAGDVAHVSFELASMYSCIQGAGTCPTGAAAPADAASCSVTLDTVTAQRLP